MRKTARPGRLAIVLTLLAGVAVATYGPQAGAADTPIYNAPPGGGPVEEIVITTALFTLGPEGGPNDENEGAGLVERPDGAFALKYASFDLVDENDVPIGRHDVHLHHYVIAALNKVDTACPSRKVFGMNVRPLIGSGMERTPISLPDPYALEVPADEAWGAQWHLMNMSDVTQSFKVKYTLGIQRGATADNSRYVTPYWADANTCPAGTTWDVPGDGGPGGVEVRTKTWAMPFDGYVVGIGGHLHDGGLSVLTRHEDDTLLCENEATYAGGMLDEISGCPLHDTVTEGELLSVTSRYDNSAPHDDVMGMAVMFLWQGDQGDPPVTTTTTSTTTTTVAETTSTTATTVDPGSTTTTTADPGTTSTTAPAGSTTSTTADPAVLGVNANAAVPLRVQPVLAG